MSTLKKGWHTTEFWKSLGGQILMVAVLIGSVSMMDAEFIGKQWAIAVESVFAFVGIWLNSKSYIESRTELKKQEQEVEAVKQGLQLRR